MADRRADRPGGHSADTPDGRPDGPREEAAHVRPYLLTGGRTRSSSAAALPLEALVEAVPGAAPAGLAAEGRRILELTTGEYLSVAELSAHLRLPVGVVRVLVGDLDDVGALHVHGLGAGAPGATPSSPATMLSVLESVLDGINSL